MKNLYILLFASLCFVGCSSDDLENLTSISDDVIITETFEVRVSNTDIPYTASIDFDASQENAFSQFGNKIDDVTVTKITYTILDNVNYQNGENAVIENATFDFNSASGSSTNVASISNQNIAAILGSRSDMNFDQNALNAIANEIRSTGKINADVTVELSDPVDFDLEVTVEMVVTGSIVD